MKMKPLFDDRANTTQLHLKFDEGENSINRTLQASILERFPTIDRQDVTLPEELVDFFFNNVEKVIVNTDESAVFKAKEESESFKQAVCTGADGKISYITCHMYYEDLHKIEIFLPAHKTTLEQFKEIKQGNVVAPQSPEFGALAE